MSGFDSKWLAEMMERQRWNQTHVSRLLKIGRDKVSRIIHGSRRLTLEEAIKLCEAAGEPLADRTRRRFRSSNGNSRKRRDPGGDGGDGAAGSE